MGRLADQGKRLRQEPVESGRRPWPVAASPLDLRLSCSSSAPCEVVLVDSCQHPSIGPQFEFDRTTSGEMEVLPQFGNQSHGNCSSEIRPSPWGFFVSLGYFLAPRGTSPRILVDNEQLGRAVAERPSRRSPDEFRSTTDSRNTALPILLVSIPRVGQ